jgi:hypothetical protein
VIVHIYETFKSRKKALRWAERYLASYSPLAYGTSLKVWKSSFTGQWHVSGTRFNSAD